MSYNPYTNKPSPEMLKLIEREQNLQFINYCPRCDKWMEKEHLILEDDLHSYFSYKCDTCSTRRSSKEKIKVD